MNSGTAEGETFSKGLSQGQYWTVVLGLQLSQGLGGLQHYGGDVDSPTLDQTVGHFEKSQPLTGVDAGESSGTRLEEALDLPPARLGESGGQGDEGPLILPYQRKQLLAQGQALGGEVVGTMGQDV